MDGYQAIRRFKFRHSDQLFSHGRRNTGNDMEYETWPYI